MNYCAVWVDHLQAQIIKADEYGEISIREFKSEVEPHSRAGRSDGEHLTLTDQKSLNEHRDHEMKEFCGLLVEQLQDADELVILGPGNAKQNLKLAVEADHNLAPKLKGVETSHPLSEAELIGFIMDYFQLPKEDR